ncbi:DMT family transporter [Albimonas sp. CAU 1670]|uniref:DMT family transporter n=1 Tax=Albimonas sp. CAU 1670 TaxID=3032599 RepID=UPI0023DCD37F|nr:DMT family transporter [Albimonas sp. CAU 1670]MDF2233237.1 DMT family transporter [Albimonas sp. CAU 1670]
MGDALIKLTSDGFAIWQIFVLRSLIALPALLAILLARGRGRPRAQAAPAWTALRSLMLVGMWVSYYAALPHLALSAAAAAYYTAPIFITLFAAAVVGDRISARGWIAVALGFAGAALILRPAPGDFNLHALLPLVSAMLYAGAMILTRTRCRGEDPILLSLALNLGFVLVGLVATAGIALLPEAARQGFLLAPWSAMGAREWGAMALLAVAILIGSLGAAFAYQNAPPAVIGAFDFTYVGFAALWGLAVFAETPDRVAALGMALIVGAGLLSLRR